MKTKILLLILPAVIAIMLCSCQKTPEEDLVKNKSEQNVEQEMKEAVGTDANQEGKKTNQKQKLAELFPTNYQDTLKIDGATILIDATLHIPDTTTVTSNKARAQTLSIEEVRKRIAYFAREYSCYPLNETLPKSVIMDNIIALRQQIAELESGDMPYTNEGDGTLEEQLTQLRTQLQQEEAAYAQEKTEVEPLAIDQIEFDENGVLEVQYNLEKVEPARISFLNNPELGTYMEYRNYSPAYDVVDSDVPISISEEEAVQMAEDIIADLDLGDLQVLGITKEPQIVNGNAVGYYNISYGRKEGGLMNMNLQEAPVAQTDVMENTTVEEYSAKIGQVQETIAVDDTGVIGLQIWEAPENLETINEEVSLRSFDDIKKDLTENLNRKSWKMPGVQETVNITDIYLSIMYIVNRNNNSEYITVPVWDFCGYIYPDDASENLKYNAEKANNKAVYKTTYMTLNAVDGSIISRQAGY